MIIIVAVHFQHWNVARVTVNYENRLKPKLTGS